jgi:hypothetical protein
VARYIAALSVLADYCSFGESLHEMLRDCLVCGVNHDGIQRRLLAEKNLTYEKALEIARAVEVVEQGARDLRKLPQNGSGQVLCHYTTSGGQTKKEDANTSKERGASGSKSTSCYRCGNENHLAPACKFKETVCHYCKKKGHLARVCKAKKRESKEKPHRSHFLSSTSEEEGTDSYSMYTVWNRQKDPITLSVELNDLPVQMEIDTGAALSVINKATYQFLQQQAPTPLQKSNVCLKTYTGEEVEILGAICLRVQIGDKVKQGLVIQVVDGAGPNLLGRDWLTTFEITLNGQVLHCVQLSQPLKEVLDKHTAVFADDLGCLQGQKIHLEIDKSVPPKFCKARPVPITLKDKVNAELDRLENLGIITSNHLVGLLP